MWGGGADVGLKWVLMFPIAGSCRGEEGHREGPHYPPACSVLAAL